MKMKKKTVLILEIIASVPFAVGLVTNTIKLIPALSALEKFVKET